jgi:hypothetical protein
MKTKQCLVLIPFAFFMFTTSSCTTQAWYEAVKEGAKNNCNNQPPSEAERCLDNLNKKTYEEYEKERSGQK